tara:strand:+ start:3256 stop:3522 length:267 start_codon:yes stop_codon:yes gene_type:complete
MANVKFKDAKTGKPVSKTNVARAIKPKVKMKKRGLKYSPLKPSEEFGEGVRQRAAVRSAKYTHEMAGTKNKKKVQMRKYYNNDYTEGE